MAKTNFKKQMLELNKRINNIPSLSESLSFAPVGEEMCEDDEMEMYDEEPSMPIEEPTMGDRNMEMPGKDVVDQIRKMALKAMAELADNTENSYYLVLKKIWQMADKNPEEGKMNKGE